MSKMSQLAAELDELRHCGEILIGISDTLREMFSGNDETPETPAEKPKGKAKAAKTAPEKEQEPEKPAEPEKKLTLADVRAVLADKSRAGFTEEGKALITKHGADRLSEVPETEYAALLKDAEVLGCHVSCGWNQDDYQKKYDALSERYDKTKARLEKVSGMIMERQAKCEMIEAFLKDLAEIDLREFTEELWFNLLDHMTVYSKKDVRFTFKNGTEITVG